MYKITKESLKFPQIDAAMRYIWDNTDKYPHIHGGHPLKEVQLGLYIVESAYEIPLCGIYEFGTGSGRSLDKILNYVIYNNWYEKVEIYGFDKWEGLPKEDSSVECFAKYQPGTYKYTKPSYDSFDNIYLVNKWFSELNTTDAEGMRAAILVHVDCDLYSSTLYALSWMLDNKLIAKNTLLAFDEYQSTTTALSGGESLAWIELQDKYHIKSTSVYHNIYTDKDTQKEITQCVFRVDEFYSNSRKYL